MKRIALLAALAISAIVAIGPGIASAGTTRYPTVFTKFKYKVKNGQRSSKGRSTRRRAVASGTAK